jgi:hypothetical protein
MAVIEQKAESGLLLGATQTSPDKLMSSQIIHPDHRLAHGQWVIISA